MKHAGTRPTRRLPLVVLLLIGSAAVLHADVVTVSHGPQDRGRLQREGEVLDYTGEQLRLRLPNGREVEIPTASVVAVEAPLSESHRKGDRALAQHRYQAALTHYRSVRDEQRRWVRRLLGSQVARALHGLGRNAEAGRMFLAVVKEDPATPYLAAIPLGWTTSDRLDAATAASWLSQTNSSVATLMGASYSLGGPQQAKAVAALKRLVRHSDPRIAGLAEGQLFRTQLASAEVNEIKSFAKQVVAMPPSIQAGPWYVLGRAYAQGDQSLPASEALMRVPILFPEHGNLAAESLLLSAKLLAEHAAQSAEKLSSAEQSELFRSAVLLYQEVLIHYADSTAAAEAKQRLEKLRVQLAPAAQPGR